VGVEIVFTERRAQLTDARAANYERLRERVADASGKVVRTAHYDEIDPRRLRDAESIVLSGSSAPWSEHDPTELERLGEALREAGRPVLGICAGMQLQALFAGGAIGPAHTREDGFLPIRIHDRSDLLRDLPDEVLVFQDHGDEITELTAGFRVLASSDACAVQAIGDAVRRWWGTQFHPEEFRAEHPAGERVLRSFFSLAA
jgi:GMP synthase (glutamine-hydrolysing)